MKLNNEIWDESLAMLGSIISLPDDKFNTLAPHILEDFRNTLMKDDSQRELAIAARQQQLTADKLAEERAMVAARIDTEMSEYSEEKREFLKQFFVCIYNSIEDSFGKDKRVIQIPIELCSPDAKIPTYAHTGDAGMDVYSTIDCTLAPGGTQLIPLGFKVAIPMGYELQVRPRSGLSLRTHLRIANSVGTIDSGFRQEVGIILTNCAPSITDFGDGRAETCKYGPSYTISKGDRIAQLVLQEVPTALFVETPDITKISGDRGGGFGSTGA